MLTGKKGNPIWRLACLLHKRIFHGRNVKPAVTGGQDKDEETSAPCISLIHGPAADMWGCGTVLYELVSTGFV